MSSDDTAPVKVIELAKPVEHHGKIIDRVTLKEPSGGLYRKLGEPRILVRSGEGAAYFVEQPGTISAYLDKVVDHEMGGVLVDMLSLADAMRVKLGLFGFFMDAEAIALSTLSTPSSSA